MAYDNPPRPESREPSWLVLAVLALGLASVLTMLGTDRLRHRSIVHDETLLQTACELRVDVALAHLWLEEHVTGDQVPGDILERVDRALDRTGALLRPSPEALHPPIEDDALRRRAELLESHLSRFRQVSLDRRNGYAEGREVGIGSEMDRLYDQVFSDVLNEAEGLEVALERNMDRNKDRSRWIFTSILALWGVVVLGAALGLHTHERHRRQAELALRTSEAQLQRSQKMDALGRLAGGIAHDINNYLAAIRGHCELVRMKLPAEDRVARKMDAAIRTVGKASALIERLLAFGRRQPVEPEVVSLNRVLRSLERMMRPSIGESIHLETRLAPALWNVEIDPAQLEQVIVNLMVNARDAMPTGGTITLVTANREDDERVVLEVSDTGHGIAPGDLDKVFEPFWTTKEKGSSSGLGLSIVYRIVSQSGGTVEIASDLGQGTVFTLTWPRCRKPETHVSAADALGKDDLGGDEEILLVDDNADFRDATAALLEELGYRMLTASDAEQALHVLEQRGGVDLVVTDVVMPGMSGPEMVTELERRGPVKVVFVSGYTDDVTIRHGVDRGRVSFLKKPFSSLELARVVRELLDSETVLS